MRSLDFTVELFRSAEEFLKSSRLQEVSCLVLDVQLPGMSGLQLQSHLAERGYRIPIIFITASPTLEPWIFCPSHSLSKLYLREFDLPWG